jgi:hypothetical protein
VLYVPTFFGKKSQIKLSPLFFIKGDYVLVVKKEDFSKPQNLKLPVPKRTFSSYQITVFVCWGNIF